MRTLLYMAILLVITRGIALNVIYRFNPRQNKYKGRAANEEEMKRL